MRLKSQSPYIEHADIFIKNEFENKMIYSNQF